MKMKGGAKLAIRKWFKESLWCCPCEHSLRSLRGNTSQWAGLVPGGDVTLFGSDFRHCPNSAPDSVTFNSRHVFVGYGNGGAPNGSGGAMSNVVEYDFQGNMIDNVTIAGH